MSKGIREFVNAQFEQHLPNLKELGNAGFRAKVMGEAITKFGISIASAATHYNFSLKAQRLADPKSVATLGRPEDKKGGRPVLKPVTVLKAKTGEVVVANVSRAKANELILAAVTKKRTKLVIKEDITVEAVTS